MSGSILLFHSQDNRHFVSIMYAYVSFLTNNPVSAAKSGAQSKSLPKKNHQNRQVWLRAHKVKLLR